MTDHEQFADLVKSFGNVSELARRLGWSRRSIELKVAGDRPIRPSDIYAVRYVLENQDQAEQGP